MGRPILGTYVQPIKASDHSTPALGDTGYVTLTSGATYYYPLGVDTATTSKADRIASIIKRAPLELAQVQWDGNVILTITIEDTVWPDVAPDSTTTGDWIQENPSTSYVAVVGTGVTVSSSTVSVPGGGSSAGGCTFHLGNFANSRLRLKLVVGGTGGSVRVGQNAKEF